MGGAKEIKRRIKTVENTSKITYAMKLVSAAKLKKVQDAVTEARVYTAELKALLQRMTSSLSGAGLSSPLLEAKNGPVNNMAIVVVGGQRGLCGAYNSGLHKRLEAEIAQIRQVNPDTQISFYVFGKKPAEYIKKTGRVSVKSFENLGENAGTWPVDELCSELEQEFLNGKYDEIRVCFTRFKSAISVTPVCERIFPLVVDFSKEAGAAAPASGPTKFEPDIPSVISAILPRVARTQLRQACLDAKASETGSRMTAMEAATRNAKELGKKLQRNYNRARQQGITSQLLDIIGGAEAV